MAGRLLGMSDTLTPLRPCTAIVEGHYLVLWVNDTRNQGRQCSQGVGLLLGVVVAIVDRFDPADGVA